MKKMLTGLLSLLLTLAACGCSLAESATVTLAELKAQAPDRLQMTVVTNAGSTVTVDAPVILPDTDKLPVLLCRSQRFDITKVLEAYPLEKGTPTYNQFHSLPDRNSPFLNVVKESKSYLLWGRTDTTARYALPVGMPPPENSLTAEAALDLILRNNAPFGGDPDVDLRLNHAIAMSGLCKMKSAKTTDPATGVSFRMIVADPEQPVKGREKGLWKINLAQYLNGVRVIDESHSRLPVEGVWKPYPTKNECLVMDEDNFRLLLGYLHMERELTEDYPLAAWPAVEETLRELIRQDKLKSVYQVELVYLVKTFQADNDAWQRGDLKLNTPFDLDCPLVPVWEIKGWGLNENNKKYFASGSSPDRETLLLNGWGQQYRAEDYTLRLNADTATPMTNQDRLYSGAANAQ